MCWSKLTMASCFAATLAFSLLIPHPNHARRQLVRERQALALLSFASVIFRAELALLLGAVGLHIYMTSQVSVFQLAVPVVAASTVALLVSLPIDSYFWLRPVWPELWAFYYNAVLGNASSWGTEPWHYYFLSAIPRLLLNPVAWAGMIPLAAILPATKQAARSFLAPCLLFVTVYSLQPHKETRFILYIVPPLTAAAALGANYVFSRRTKSALYAAASLALILSTLASAAAGLGMALLSSLNYPGGDALTQLFIIIARASNGHAAPAELLVHTDVLSCMTGVTLFGQNPSGLPLALLPPSQPHTSVGADRQLILFDKTEDKTVLVDPAFWDRFDYVLAEDPSLVLGEWDIVGVVYGYAGVELVLPGYDDMTAADEKLIILGKGAVVSRIKSKLQSLTGGWWIGPRMAPRIRILRRSAEQS